MRKFIFAIVIMVGVVFLLARTADLSSILDTLKKGDLRFIGLAFVFELLWIVNIALSYKSIYHVLGLKEKTSNLLVMSSSANFINIIAPSAGMGSFAILISEARKRGYSSARATVAGGMFALFEYLGFFVFLTLGFIVLIRRDNLKSTEITATIILAVIIVALAFLIFLGARSEKLLGRFLAWMARMINKIMKPFLRREFLSEQHAYHFAHEAAEGIKMAREKPSKLILPAFLSLTSKTILLIILFLMFLAFNVPYSIGTLVAGFSIGYLFYIVSPTPAGIGFVEGALALALTSLNVPLGAATVLTIAYRGVTFWLPFFIGMLAFRWLTKEGKLELPA